jgi:hypothetical protein
MYKLQIFAITNICKPRFVSFGRIDTGSRSLLRVGLLHCVLLQPGVDFMD